MATQPDLSNLVLPEIDILSPIVTCTIEGILEEEDLRALVIAADGAPKEEEDAKDLKKIRERHHSVARLIASGMEQGMVATISNYTPEYLSVLLNNPAMQELVGFYRAKAGNAAEVIGEKLRHVGLAAIEKLAERMDKTGEDAMDDHALISVAKLGLDRSGHGPSTTSHNVTEHHVVDHARIKELDAQARGRSAERIVPVDKVRAALPAPKEPEA